MPTNYIQAFMQATQTMLEAGMEHVAKTIAIYNGDFPAIEEDAMLEFVINTIEDSETHEELAMALTQFANMFGMGVEDMMVYATAVNAFRLLTQGIHDGVSNVH